ncbi:vitamin K epoxide reductase family protein [Tenacibaculum ovolyticum]|uniref:vitamin K epoxide reductase family protein n=1 Tax=Tenacibaculum ovolyticum TaxID=104270 RepID=UPI00041DEB82|nr:vitamin K epoxide reductase family protein [Tenacibaculum ovolyticum]
MKDTLINLVQRLLKNNQISFDKEELSFQIQSHPSYPSLHAITGVLDHFNIENVAADVPVNAEILLQLPNCFIAQVNTEQGKNLVTVEKEGTNCIIYNTENKRERVSKNYFLKNFTGIIVAVEQSEDSTQLKTSFNITKIIALIALTLLTSFLIYLNTSSLYVFIYLILSIIGIIISVAIIKQELGLKTTIGDAFCSGTDEKKDCDAVLTSKGAEIFKNYKLSDFSILYFTGLTLLTFFQTINPAISYTTSLIAIPITLYSLYYQYAIVKKWCLLCVSIVGVLWLQALIPIITNTYVTNFIITDVVIFSLVVLVTWLSWHYLKPLFTNLNQLKKEKIEYVKFKRNYTLFDSLLQKSPQLNTQIENCKEIIFGNPNSNLEIVIVTNPFCGHCKPIHKHIDEILQRYHQNVKIITRFTINTEDEKNDLVKITSRLLEIYDKKGEIICIKAMSEIYENGDTEAWLKKWGNCNNTKYYVSELEKGSNWCKVNAINFTPEILINGKSFPKEYSRTDLTFFIEELEENCKPLVMV